MVVFDVDGTLIGGESTDWTCFDTAFLEVTGRPLDRERFVALAEVTAKACVHQILDDLSIEERNKMEAAIEERYVVLLKEAVRANPGALRAADGAVELLRDLRARNIPVAIATGDWRQSILIKLTAAGIPFEGIPIATSSENYARSEIIAAAVAATGARLEDAIYVGDGPWDYRATRKLGIPFVGVGKRTPLLRQEGAINLLSTMHPDEFWRVRATMGVMPPPLRAAEVSMEWETSDGAYMVSTDRRRIDLDVVCALLATSYWAGDRPRAVVEASIAASLNFGLYRRSSRAQVGYARVITDGCTFSWLCDVAIDDGERGHGLGKFLMSSVMAHPVILRTGAVLGTKDAHGLYEKYGFVRYEAMRRPRPKPIS
ncbi:MAG TPA: GNAT family N-acetyltransferase [Opitutaceae bacterium]|jgi:phosphoglycolate phosphatase-like HAD superfamily hydrolase/GNAT superfamily N-acetyltransferase|nr:GNAT family N-acetyltransferase [Opitutaceae bacterium]